MICVRLPLAQHSIKPEPQTQQVSTLDKMTDVYDSDQIHDTEFLFQRHISPKPKFQPGGLQQSDI